MKVEVFGQSKELDESLVEESRDEIRRQVKEYLEAERTSFNLEINFPDSFTGRVMQAMNDIPYGETATYGEIADQIDSAAVAVGQGCRRNPLPIIIPCHRVVGKNWIGGYSGETNSAVKQKLLKKEGADF